MAKGEIRYTLSADGTPMRQELSKAESDLKKWQGLVGRVSRDIEGSEKRVAQEIAAVGVKVKQLGDAGELAGPKLARVVAKLDELAAKGGKIPANLQAIADKFRVSAESASGLSKELDAIKTEKVTQLAGEMGVLGRVMAAAGPAGLAVAASLALVVGTAGSVATVLTKSTAEAAQFAGRLTDMSVATGLSTESLQIFQRSADLGGGSLESLASASAKVRQSIVDSPEKFDRLGLSVSRLVNLRPEEQLYAVAQALKDIENPTVRDAVAMDVLGKKAGEVFEILRNDPAAVRAEMERLGLAIDNGTVAKLDDLGDAATTLRATWQAVWLQIGASIGSSDELRGFLSDLASLVGSVSRSARDAAPSIRAIADQGFAYLRNVLGGVVSILGPLLDGFRALIGLLPSVGASVRGALNLATMGAADGVAALGALRGAGASPRRSLSLAAPVGLLSEVAAGTYAGRVPGDAPNDKAKAKSEADKAERELLDLKTEALKNQYARFKAESERLDAESEAIDKIQKSVYARVTNLLMNGGPLASGSPAPMIVPKGPDGKPKQFDLSYTTGFTPVNAPDVSKPAFSASQALQELANVAAISSSKLAKAFASVAGGAAGMVSGLSKFFGKDKLDFGKGLTGVLGKAGVIGGIAASALSIGSSIFGLFKKKPKPKEVAPPPEPPKAPEPVDGNLLAGSLAGATKGIVAKSADDIRAQSKILSLSFWQVFTEQGLTAAAASFKDVFNSIRDKLGSLGGDDVATAILGPIGTLMDKMDNEAFAGAADGAQQYAQLLKELRTKEVPMTTDQFGAFEEQLQAAKEQAAAGGATTKESLIAIAPMLQEIVATSAKYGLALDENTQKLIEEAKAAGLAFPTDPIDRLIGKLDEFISKLLGIDGKTVGVNVRANYIKSNDPNDSGDGSGIPGFAGGSGGLRNFGAGTLVELHGREAVLTEDQYRDRGAGRPGSGGGDSGGGSPPVDLFRGWEAQPSGFDPGSISDAFDSAVNDLVAPIRDLITQVKSMASNTGTVLIQPQVAVGVDAGSTRRNQEDLLRNVEDRVAEGVRRGTSPVLGALRDLGYRPTR